jgi:hypothetical protein
MPDRDRRSSFALIKDRLRGFPGVPRAKDITETERDTCERYGEHVIGTMLAGNVPPPSSDLQALFQIEEARQRARDWLTERAAYREVWERWKSTRDLVLEIAVILLILAEIILSVVFGVIAIREGREQSKVLAHMEQSAAATASAMTAASSSLQSLADAQAKSLDRLNQMSDTLRDSLKTSSGMASATHKQLNILEQEQADRAAQLARKPKLQFHIGSVPLNPGPFNVIHPPSFPVREQTDTSVIFDSGITNAGNAPATRVQLRVVVFATDVSLSSDANLIRPNEPADTPVRTSVINIDLIRPHVNMPMTLSFSFPKGRTPFQVLFNVDADEIETGTPLGELIITPRKPSN